MIGFAYHVIGSRHDVIGLRYHPTGLYSCINKRNVTPRQAHSDSRNLGRAGNRVAATDLMKFLACVLKLCGMWPEIQARVLKFQVSYYMSSEIPGSRGSLQLQVSYV